MIKKGQLRRWNKRLSSLDGKVFLVLDHRTVTPAQLGLHGSSRVRLWSTLRDGRIDERTDAELEDFSEVIE